MDERIERILKHPATIPTAVGIATFGVGMGVGYILGERRGLVKGFRHAAKMDEESYEAAVEEQLELDLEPEDKEELLTKKNPVFERMLQQEQEELPIVTFHPRPDPADIQVDEGTLEHIEKIVAEGGTPTYADYEPKNVFATDSSDDDNWDYEEEFAKRTEAVPYVIHKDEFWTNENDWDQSTLTYYAGDDILVDQEESPIYNTFQVAGPDFKEKFGHGSTDPNVVLIRNCAFMAEYEILLDHGAYSEEVLGIIAEEEFDPNDIQHSLRKARARRRKEREE